MWHVSGRVVVFWGSSVRTLQRDTAGGARDGLDNAFKYDFKPEAKQHAK